MKYKTSLYLLLFFISGTSIKAETEFTPIKPPGQFVLLKTDGYLHRMYFDCRGEKSPTIIIDVGIADASINWFGIMHNLSNETRTCLYDRSGYGWSDTGPGARTTAQITKELFNLVSTAKIPGPYILVGHSFGGFTARYFANQYPEKTVGVVLVDSSHPEQIQRLSVPDHFNNDQTLITGRNATVPPDYLNEIEKKWYYLNSSRKATLAQMNELKYFAKSAEQVSNLGPLPDIPLVILTRGKSQLPTINGKDFESEWLAMQKDLGSLSKKSEHIIVKNSGHNIYQDAPDVVINNILSVVDIARININATKAQKLY